ncbi:hypothetical protein BGW80DRAFT_1455938 [Lactifluus volemus]|nr:hypothetical protein BGW80DRAFT_1455938 [Lactifluus volemus]
MGSIALGAAFAAVQLVHQAYSKVKTSKARCARLVERCQFIVERLERISMTKRGGDAVIIRERIRELERAFGYTAQTILQVGQQSIIASLLRSESNALQIEACNEALTDLIFLFNLEETVDVHRWQMDLDVAHVRDHEELLSMGRRIEKGNAGIHRELEQQGATIAEVLHVLHDINASLHRAYVLPERINSNEAFQRPWPTSSLPDAAQTTTTTDGESNHRRFSFTKRCAKMVPLAANMFLKLYSPSGIRRSVSIRSELRLLPRSSNSNVVVADSSGHGDVPSAVNLASESPPPPAYHYHLRVINPTPEATAAAAIPASTAAANVSSFSRLTVTSIEAVRAPDSPVPEFPSPKPSSIESVFGSTQSLASVSGGTTMTPRRRSIRPSTPMVRRRVRRKANVQTVSRGP